MNLAPVVLQLRAADTRFGDNIGGAADITTVLNQPADVNFPEGAYVTQLGEAASSHENDNHINQLITETFAIVIILQNDTQQRDKTGLTAHDMLKDIRSEFFKAILGYQLDGAESLIFYIGARLVRLTRANFIYQFEFGVDTRITMEDAVTTDAVDSFDRIVTEYILAPDDELPVSRIPVEDDSIVDMNTIIDGS